MRELSGETRTLAGELYASHVKQSDAAPDAQKLYDRQNALQAEIRPQIEHQSSLKHEAASAFRRYQDFRAKLAADLVGCGDRLMCAAALWETHTRSETSFTDGRTGHPIKLEHINSNAIATLTVNPTIREDPKFTAETYQRRMEESGFRRDAHASADSNVWISELAMDSSGVLWAVLFAILKVAHGARGERTFDVLLRTLDNEFRKRFTRSATQAYGRV